MTLTQVVERQTIFDGILLHPKAHLVRYLFLQITMVNVQHLVETLRDMETNARFHGHFLALSSQFIHLLKRDPFLV